MDPGPSFTSEIQSTAFFYFLHFLQVIIIIHTIRLILCDQQAGEINNLTVRLGQSFLVVLCAGVCPSPTGFITLVSFWGKTCCYTHHTFLLGYPNGRVIHVQASSFLAPLPGIWGATWSSKFQVLSTASLFWRHCNHLPGITSIKLLQGESHTSNLFTLLLSCLVYFYFVLFVSFIKNPKKIVTCFLSCHFESS